MKQRFRYFTELPEELQIEVFLRLPVKSLLFCKCVCKLFRNLIENRNFALTHLTSFTPDDNDSEFLILDYGVGIRSPFLVFGYDGISSPVRFGHDGISSPYRQFDHFLFSVDKDRDVLSYLRLTPPTPIGVNCRLSYFVGSCNGLICVALWFDDQVTDDFLLLLWNPVIRQFRYLPKPQHKCVPVALEFGFVPETNNYVVVKVGSSNLFEVYNMSTDSWKSIDWFAGFDFVPTVSRDGNSVFVNGSFHWPVKNSVDNYIVYYKLKDEELGLVEAYNGGGIMDVVNFYNRKRNEWHLAVIEESLGMIYWNSEESNIFEIWVMNDYGIGESWSRLFQIVNRGDYLFPVGYWANGWVIIDQVCTSYDRRFQFGDLKTRSKKQIPKMETRWYATGFCKFVETLVPVRLQYHNSSTEQSLTKDERR